MVKLTMECIRMQEWVCVLAVNMLIRNRLLRSAALTPPMPQRLLVLAEESRNSGKDFFGHLDSRLQVEGLHLDAVF